MRHIIMASLAGALLMGAPTGAAAQFFNADTTGNVERGDRAERQERRRLRAEQGGNEGFERRGDRAERGERFDRGERLEQAQRFDREERFERRERFEAPERRVIVRDRFEAPERRVIVRERFQAPTIVERRIVRQPRARTVCTTRIRERVTPGGVVIRRPVEVCRQVLGSL